MGKNSDTIQGTATPESKTKPSRQPPQKLELEPVRGIGYIRSTIVRKAAVLLIPTVLIGLEADHVGDKVQAEIRDVTGFVALKNEIENTDKEKPIPKNPKEKNWIDKAKSYGDEKLNELLSENELMRKYKEMQKQRYEILKEVDTYDYWLASGLTFLAMLYILNKLYNLTLGRGQTPLARMARNQAKIAAAINELRDDVYYIQNPKIPDRAQRIAELKLRIAELSTSVTEPASDELQELKARAAGENPQKTKS